MKRVVLFLATNLAILVVLSVVLFVLSALGIQVSPRGDNYTGLLIFAAVFGMGGAMISLLMSKWIAKRATGAQVITQPRSAAESWLLATVQRQARQAGIGMPEVAVFDSPDPNAFATGANKNNALVAVSTGLLANMQQDEVEAVLGHEVSHIANGDMVTLTLIQGVLNTFVIFAARVVGSIVDGRRDGGGGVGYFFTVMILEVLFGILASLIVCWFSRQREFRADAGGAHLAGKRKMIGALERLKAAQGVPSLLPQQIKTFGIRGGQLARMFATHPPLDVRIARLSAG